jgi:hypothetical protein
MGLDGRAEPRVKKTVPVCLVAGGEVQVTELTFTVNVSTRGARVATKRRWHPGEEPRLATDSGVFRGRARVVYCQQWTDRDFFIGLKFFTGAKQWEDQFWAHSILTSTHL